MRIMYVVYVEGGRTRKHYYLWAKSNNKDEWVADINKADLFAVEGVAKAFAESRQAQYTQVEVTVKEVSTN